MKIVGFLKQFQCSIQSIPLQKFQGSSTPRTEKEVLTSLSQSEQSPISSSSMLDKCLRNPKSEPGTFFKVVNDCENQKKKTFQLRLF